MKLNKFNNFLFEKIKNEIINESKLKYMDEFKAILKDFELYHENRSVRIIAKALLIIYGKEININQNYIDIDKEVDKLSFIPDDKVKYNDYINLEFTDDYIKNTLSSLHIVDILGLKRENFLHGIITKKKLNELNIENKWKIIKTIDGSEVGFNDFLLVYLENFTNNLYHIIIIKRKDSDETYFKDADLSTIKRNTIKVGRLVNKILDMWIKENPQYEVLLKIKPSDIEDFVNAFSSEMLFRNNAFNYFEIVKGEDIRYWYLEDNYSSNKGQLSASCMRYKKCQSYLDIYVENPEVCQLLIFKDMTGKKINGRALLWTDVDGNKWMDRIYCVSDKYQEIFKKWCNKNNYKELYDKFIETKVKVKNKEYEEYPYMDSLGYLKLNANENNEAFLYSHDLRPERPFYILVETNGTKMVKE